MSIDGQGHFFTIYFPGFVCFVLYLAKIAGERLQDHWSSGLNYDLDRPFALRSVSIGPKCSGTFYHTYFPFRLYTVKRIPEVEEFRICVKRK